MSQMCGKHVALWLLRRICRLHYRHVRWLIIQPKLSCVVHSLHFTEMFMFCWLMSHVGMKFRTPGVRTRCQDKKVKERAGLKHDWMFDILCLQASSPMMKRHTCAVHTHYSKLQERGKNSNNVIVVCPVHRQRCWGRYFKPVACQAISYSQCKIL